MEVPPAVHPTQQILDAFGLGKLDERATEAVGQHLESCPSCRRRVAELTTDTFLDHFRSARTRTDSPDAVGSPLGEAFPRHRPSFPRNVADWPSAPRAEVRGIAVPR